MISQKVFFINGSAFNNLGLSDKINVQNAIRTVFILSKTQLYLLFKSFKDIHVTKQVSIILAEQDDFYSELNGFKMFKLCPYNDQNLNVSRITTTYY